MSSVSTHMLDTAQGTPAANVKVKLEMEAAGVWAPVGEAVWNAALDRIIAHARTARINREIPELISGLFRRAIALGHGNRDIATVIDVLRAG